LEDIVPPAFILGPLKNAPFCPIPALGSNFNSPPNFGRLIPLRRDRLPLRGVGPTGRRLGLKSRHKRETFFKGLILMKLTVAS
jgi:hypothetical protein